VNLFVTNKDPIRAAQHLDDKRVVKIALEATQILSCVLRWRGIDDFYGMTHTGHPVTLWAAAEPCHAAWTLRYGLALCDVYKTFGRKDQHACEPVLLAMRRHIRYTGKEPRWFQNSARRTKQGIDFSHLDVCTAYRKYLCARWPNDKREPLWTGRPRPRWARFTWSGSN
jgi:hypothetical protein